MSKTVTFSAKVYLIPSMKVVLLIASLLRWNWLADKCFKVEILKSNTAYLD